MIRDLTEEEIRLIGIALQIADQRFTENSVIMAGSYICAQFAKQAAQARELQMLFTGDEQVTIGTVDDEDRDEPADRYDI